MQTTSVVLGFILGYLTCSLLRRKPVKILKGTNHKFVLVVRNDITLTKNQTAQYCSKAALECYKKAKSSSPETVMMWERNSQPKIVLKIEKNGNEELLNLQRKAESIGVTSVLIKQDRFPGSDNSHSVIGIGPGPEELINEITGHLKLL